jgi:hypothetical protein
VSADDLRALFPDMAPAPADPGAGVPEEDITLNLTGVNENQTYKPIPPGTYDAIVFDSQFGRSNRSNNPMITWQFAVVGGEHENRKLYQHTVITEQGLPRLKKLLLRLAPEMDLSQFNPRTDPQKLVGRPCRIVVGVRPYQGEIRNEVKDVQPAPQGSFLG